MLSSSSSSFLTARWKELHWLELADYTINHAKRLSLSSRFAFGYEDRSESIQHKSAAFNTPSTRQARAWTCRSEDCRSEVKTVGVKRTHGRQMQTHKLIARLNRRYGVAHTFTAHTVQAYRLTIPFKFSASYSAMAQQEETLSKGLAKAVNGPSIEA